MKLKEWKDRFFRWLDGEYDVMENIMDGSLEPDEGHEKRKHVIKEEHEKMKASGISQTVISMERKGFYQIYLAVAIVSCIALIGVLLYTVALLPQYGQENPRAVEVSDRYIEHGLEETGAVNIVAGMILDYRAFDTLGESSVLFTAVMAVIILLKKDGDKKKEMTERQKKEEALQQHEEELNDRHRDVILKKTAGIVAPFIMMFGIYVVLNGHISPGGGFSGGAIIGAGLILISQAFGSKRTKKFFNFKVFTIITSGALLSYAALKTYSFYTGSHHMETGVPHGIPGAILSSGFILPLNIFVGLIVACTMFGFYSLFSKGEI